MKLDQQNNPLGINYEDDSSETFVKLNCMDCDFVECGIKLRGTIIRGKEGCTKKVSEENAVKFYHYTEEVIPFWRTYDSEHVRQSYQEVIDFLYNKIYTAPIGQRLDPSGKVRESGY